MMMIIIFIVVQVILLIRIRMADTSHYQKDPFSSTCCYLMKHQKYHCDVTQSIPLRIQALIRKKELDCVKNLFHASPNRPFILPEYWVKLSLYRMGTF